MRTVFSKDHSILTVATNQQSYLTFALNCAQSILLFNDICIYIVTNLEYQIPDYLKRNVQLIPALPQHAESGIAIKLHLDEYIQTAHTLFIDSDCLCFDSLDKLFEGSMGQSVTCVGRTVPAADWCSEKLAITIKKNWDIDNLIRFNGGLYYLNRSDQTTVIFDKARKIAADYDHYGFDRIKNLWINEEVPLSIAMTLYNQTPLPDIGDFMTDLYTDYCPQLNVLTGKRVLKNPPPEKPQHRWWYRQGFYSPIILHFGAGNLKSYLYKSQSMLLKLDRFHFNRELSSRLTDLVHLIYKGYYFLKTI